MAADFYEAGYYAAVTDSFGARMEERMPNGIDGFYEACKRHVKKVQDAQMSLRSAADGGNESAGRTLEDHFRAQDLTHYASVATVREFYMIGFAMHKEEQLEYMRTCLLLEDRRIAQDQYSRGYSTERRANQTPLAAPSTPKVEFFEGTQLKHDIQKTLQSRVLMNVIEFAYSKDAEGFLSILCAHSEYPEAGNLQEKVHCCIILEIYFWNDS